VEKEKAYLIKATTIALTEEAKEVEKEVVDFEKHKICDQNGTA